MKTKVLAYCLLLGCSVSACIQDEELNSEAAIDGCSGEDMQTCTINQADKRVDFYVNAHAVLSEINMTFTLPEGATIKPDETETGDAKDVYDFSNGVRRFTVTSEDQNNKAAYTIVIIQTVIPDRFSFEEMMPLTDKTPYHVFMLGTNGTTWASGNAGFKFINGTKPADTYPTMQGSDAPYAGKYARLTTRSTGVLGSLVNMPIAAGNLFIGSFDEGNAMTKPLEATRFGIQFFKRPLALKGHYKYKAGTVFTDGKETIDKEDRFDIYAILYEADSSTDMLDGRNALSSPKLVLVAQIPASEAVESDDWKAFEIPFVPKDGRRIDPEKLAIGKYKFAIVFSSSVDGAYFRGAVGSTLCIDEVELVCEEDDNQ
jgi:hypothetical protein